MLRSWDKETVWITHMAGSGCLTCNPRVPALPDNPWDPVIPWGRKKHVCPFYICENCFSFVIWFRFHCRRCCCCRYFVCLVWSLLLFCYCYFVVLTHFTWLFVCSLWCVFAVIFYKGWHDLAVLISKFGMQTIAALLRWEEYAETLELSGIQKSKAQSNERLIHGTQLALLRPMLTVTQENCRQTRTSTKMASVNCWTRGCA